MDTLTPDRRRGSVFAARTTDFAARPIDLAARTTVTERRLEVA